MSEIVSAYSDYAMGKVFVERAEPFSSRALWEKALHDRGWQILERTYYSPEGRRIPVGHVGAVKNGIGAQTSYGLIDSLSRWVFQQSALAVRHGLINLPVLCVPMRDFSRKNIERYVQRATTFEEHKNQLELLSPLSHGFPFIIIGVSDQVGVEGVNVYEIGSDASVGSDKIVIDRCIKFPAEYQQAGLGILNYFSVYLKEQYPNEDATISIEQNGLNVRMLIETPSGKSEIIEKALHEFEMIVSEKEQPEKFTNNDRVILELRNEIRIFKARVEFSQDIIGIKDKQINQLLELVSQGLAKSSSVLIDFKPVISSSSIVQVNRDLASAIGGIEELMELLPQASEESLMLSEVAGTLETIERESDPAVVRKSPAMSKFKRVIEKFLDVGDSANSAISKIENGIDVAKDLGRKYNNIAEWCGLPVIPSVFVSK